MNAIIKARKYRSRELLKAILFCQQNNKKPNRVCMNLSSTSNTSVQQMPQPFISKSTPPCSAATSFPKNIVPQVRINTMANKHCIYRPGPSGLTCRIHPFIFLYTPSLTFYLSPEIFLKILSKLYISS